MAAFTALAACGCRPNPPLPAKRPTTAPAAVPDVDHAATIRADRSFTLPNVVFVLQPDPLGEGQTAVSLATARPGPDGSRLIFGTFQRGASLEWFSTNELTFLGSAFWRPNGSGVYTPTAVYQPKEAVLKINRVDGRDVHGTVRGQFHRFNMPDPRLGRPSEVEVEIDFNALLIIK